MVTDTNVITSYPFSQDPPSTHMCEHFTIYSVVKLHYNDDILVHYYSFYHIFLEENFTMPPPSSMVNLEDK